MYESIPSIFQLAIKQEGFPTQVPCTFSSAITQMNLAVVVRFLLLWQNCSSSSIQLSLMLNNNLN